MKLLPHQKTYWKLLLPITCNHSLKINEEKLFLPSIICCTSTINQSISYRAIHNQQDVYVVKWVGSSPTACSLNAYANQSGSNTAIKYQAKKKLLTRKYRYELHAVKSIDAAANKNVIFIKRLIITDVKRKYAHESLPLL